MKYVSLVDRPVWEPMEEGISAVEGDGSSKAEDGRSWCQFLGQWHEIMLAAAGAVQQHQWRSGRVGAGDELVGVGRLGHSDVRDFGERRIDLIA